VLVRVSRPRSMMRLFNGLFLPQQGIVSIFSQESDASRSQHRLSYFLLTKYGSRGCNVAGCANTNIHRPTNLRTPGCFSAPEAVLSEVEQRIGCIQVQTHLLSEFGGAFSTLILNRISLLQVRGQTHSTDRENGINIKVTLE